MNPTENQKQKMSIGTKLLIGLGVLIAIALVANLGSKSRTDKPTIAGASTLSPSSVETNNTSVGIGQALKTDYFEVTVNKVSVVDKLNTGNEFTDQAAGEGNKFLVLNTTFKNIDDESRMLEDGEVLINYNGKEYNYDNSETIMAEGYGLLLDQINPLTSKTTKLVYKLPKEVKGTAYYHPGRSDSDDKIFLGTIQ